MISTLLAALNKLITGAIGLVFGLLARLGAFLENVVDDLFAFLGTILA